MKARLAVAVALCALAGACMDLFHSTDFETLGANASVDGGADASGPVDLCASGGDPATRAKRACAWLGACEGAKDTTRFGPCYVEARLAYDCTLNPSLRPRGAVAALWACLDKATTCEEVDACVFGGPVPKCNAVASGSFTACSGDNGVRVQCAAPGGGRPAVAEPCVLSGRSCAALDSSRSACTAARTNKCSAGTSSCAGTSASHCTKSGADDLDLGVDCAGYGAGSCAGTSSPACTPGDGAGACSGGDGQITCSGASVHVCAGGHETVIDCSKLGLDCNAADGNAAVPWSACTKGDAGACTDEDTCSGTTLQSCASGSFQTVDCAQVGLGACSLNAAGVATCAK